MANKALQDLNSMMSRNLFPRMEVPRGGNDIMNSIASGYNMMGTIMEGIRQRNDRNRLQEILKQQFGNGENGQPTQNGDGYTVSFGDTEKLNSFRNILGDNNATPVSNQTPQQDFSMQGFMRKAIDKGMLPSNAMAAYSAYLAPMEQDLRQRNIRDAMAVLARRNQGQGLSDEDYYNAVAKINYNLGEDYALKDNNAIIDQMSKVQSGLYSPIGAMHDPEKYRRIGYPINLNMWDALKPTIGVNSVNYGMGLNNNSTGSQYGGDNENARAIYTYLANKGLPDNVIAGIMGNLKAESQFDPTIGYGDGGTSGGLAQWHDEQPGVGRLTNLKNFAVNRQMDWKDLGTQLDFLMDEINKNYPNLIQEMSKMNPNEGAIHFHDVFERSRDNPEQKARRGTYADEIFNGRRSIGNGEGNTWYKKSDGVDMSNLQPQTKAGLETAGSIFKNMFGEQLMVTSGKDSNAHAQGQYSHYNGYKLDVSSPVGSQRLENPQERASFINALENAGIKVIDEWGKDKHLDLDFSGFKGGVNSVSQTMGNNQPRQYFASAFAPQVVSGRGAILNPMVAFKAAVEQAERQRNQYNADRQFQHQVYDSNRRYELDKQRTEIMKQNAAAKQKQEDLGKYQLYSYDELYKEGSPIATLNNLIASPLDENATDEQKKQHQADMVSAVNSFAQYNVAKYKDLIAKGYSEQDAQTILRNGIANAVGRSFMATQKGNADSKKYMIEKAVSDIYYRTMNLVAQDNEALSKPSSTGSFKMLNDNNYSSDKLNEIANKSKQNTDDKELQHMVKKAKLEDKLKDLIKNGKYKGLYLEREGQNLKIKMGRGITRDEAEPKAKELRRLAEEYAKEITNEDIVKYKNEVEEMRRKNRQYKEMVNSQYLNDAEAHSMFNNEDEDLEEKYLKRAETSYSW